MYAMSGGLLGRFPLFKFILFSMTATTGEKVEQPERWNYHKSGTTGKLE
jgi:hypothetical protein